MSDETVLIRRTPPSFAYVFWVSGIRRGDHAPIRAEGTTLGRGRECDVLIDDPTVSDEQARVRKEGEAWFLYDLASTNSTEVGGAAIARHQLTDKDHLKLGETELVFRVIS